MAKLHTDKWWLCPLALKKKINFQGGDSPPFFVFVGYNRGVYLSFLENIIAFLLPTQLGLHFWPSFARVAGIKIDYLSPTIYFLDFFLLLYVFFSGPKLIKIFRRHYLLFGIFGIFIIMNTFFGVSPQNSLLWWLRSLLYFFFFLSLMSNKITWTKVKTPLFLSVIFVIFLQTLQLLFKHSMGGIFYYFGERSFVSSSVGLARISFGGFDFVRPPSIFSHPNSLAGYLLVLYFLLHHFKSPFWQRLLVFFSLLLTFSKAALLALAVIVLFNANPLLVVTSSLLFSFSQITLIHLSSTFQFVSDRLFLLAAVPQIILSHPFFGIGLGNFIVSLGALLPGSHLLPSKLQPVHNLFYLFLSELGLIGLLLVLFLLLRFRSVFRKQPVLQLFAIILFVGCFDHYFWTLPQNRLIALLAFSLIL